MAIDVETLSTGEMQILGQLAVASNATLLVEIDGARAVYKPIAGEQPLWDFPDYTLSLREVAAFEFSELLGWKIVPTTILRDGPYGAGAVQEWIEIDRSIDIIELVQSDHPRLAQMALFDAMINNTDRKVGHILPRNGEIFGCDHGVTFHTDYKLRTVLWQWRGTPIPEQWLADMKRVDRSQLDDVLAELISEEEIEALVSRISQLIADGRYPEPNPEWPAIPWPPV